MNSFRTTVGCLVLVLISGCVSRQIEISQSHIREVLLRLQEDQIMDNLIRVQKGLPILHLNYTEVTGTVKVTATAKFGGSQTDTAGMIKNFFDYGASGSQEDSIVLHAAPVLKASDIYLAYLEFASDPSCFKSCNEQERPEKVVIHRKDTGHVVYYVPNSALCRTSFLRLALATVGVSKSKLGRLAYVVTVDRLEFSAADEDGKELHTIRIVFSERIPNDNGIMSAKVKGKGERFQLAYIDEENGEPVEEGDMVRALYLIYSEEDTPLKPGKLAEALVNQKVQVRLDKHIFAAPPTSEELLERLLRRIDDLITSQSGR